jgi:hypothetical protein
VVNDGGSNLVNGVKEFASPVKQEEQSATRIKFGLVFEVLFFHI